MAEVLCLIIIVVHLRDIFQTIETSRIPKNTSIALPVRVMGVPLHEPVT